MGFWPLAEKAIRNSDILLLVSDVRMPDLSRNKELERKVLDSGKIGIQVFTKIDLVSNEFLSETKKKFPDAFFVSGTQNIGIKRLRKSLDILVKRMKIKEPRIGVVGYPNLGKSAIINALARRRKTEVSAKPGTTRGVQWISAGRFSILDSPGVIPYDDRSGKLAFIGSKSAERMNNPDKVALQIIEMFVQKDKYILENRYKITIGKEDSSYDILLAIGKKRGFLSKGGIVDETKTIITVIRDWQKGLLKL